MPGYEAIVQRRRQLCIDGYASYADVGLDGPWVTPYHLAARSPTGPVLLTYNYLDAPSARAHRDVLATHGYLDSMPFNLVLSQALAQLGLIRADLYVTHAFHLLAPTRSAAIPTAAIDLSFDQVARHELVGRSVIALGDVAARACKRHGIAHAMTAHPSARGLSFAARANTLAAAINQAITCPNA